MSPVHKSQQECQAECDRINKTALKQRMKSDQFAGPVYPDRVEAHVQEVMEVVSKHGMVFSEGAKDAAVKAALAAGREDCAIAAGLELKKYIKSGLK